MSGTDIAKYLISFNNFSHEYAVWFHRTAGRVVGKIWAAPWAVQAKAFWRKSSDILSKHNERYHLPSENRLSVEYDPKMLWIKKYYSWALSPMGETWRLWPTDENMPGRLSSQARSSSFLAIYGRLFDSGTCSHKQKMRLKALERIPQIEDALEQRSICMLTRKGHLSESLSLGQMFTTADSLA